MNTIFPIKRFGDFVVYERGAWAKSQKLPRFIVLKEPEDIILEEFRRKQSALDWAEEQNNS